MGDKKKSDRHQVEHADLFRFLGELMVNIEPRSPFALATVSSDYRSGPASVEFDAHAGEAPAVCPHLSSYQPRAGDRVLVARAGKGHVILGKVAPD